MKKISIATIVAVIAALLVATVAFAMFSNGGFENGDFTGWTKVITNKNGGIVVGPPPSYNNATGPSIDDMFIVNAAWMNTHFGAGVTCDPNTNGNVCLPYAGSDTAVVNYLGKNGNLNKLTQQGLVAGGDVGTDGNYHIFFSYAPVLDKGAHTPADQPFMHVKLTRVRSGSPDKVLFDKFSYPDDGNPNWKWNTTTTSIAYMNWQVYDLTYAPADLGPGDSLTLEVAAAGCVVTQGGHWGYVYVDEFGPVAPAGNTAPSISSMTPPSGPVTGGTVVTITGSNFTSATAVTIDTTTFLAGSFTVVDDNHITFTTPVHIASTVDVSVTNTSGSAVVANGFAYYEVPTITGGGTGGGTVPNVGPVTGGTSVVITGTGLAGGTFTFGGTTASCIVNYVGTQATCTSPVHIAGTVDVVVTNPLSSSTSTGGFTYYEVPTITGGGISPNIGPIAGGTSITITGTFLTGGTFTIDGSPLLSCTVNPAGTQSTCTTPAHAAGLVDVAVSTSGGTATSTGGFTYISSPSVSSITRVNPNPTNLGSVAYTVTFSAAVTGVNLTTPFSDFALTTTGNLTGASISAVSGSGTTYTVTVNTGTGNGTIRLDVVDDDTITAGLIPLGGVGIGNGNFTTGEIYTINKNVEVYIHGDLKGTYSLAAIDSTRPSYAGIDSGPVKVISTNVNAPVIAAIRSAWAVNGVTTSYSQLMGLPQAQLSNKYVFPGYNNVTLNEQLRISNVDSVPSTVTVTIAGILRGTYTLQPNDSVRINYPGLDSGPVVVEGTPNVNIISSIRMAWAVNGVTKSFTNLMGLPAIELSSKYVFPAYNNVTLNEQLRIGNVDTVPSTVTVTIGGVLRGTYTLQPSEAIRVNYAGLDTGPVIVVGTPNVNIISSIRSAWMVNGVITSFAQLMGMPQEQLSNKYLFPVYDNVSLNEQLRIGNVDTVPSTVTVTIGGVLRGTYTLQPSEAVRINYVGLDSGLVVVEGTSGVKITSSIRSAWLVNGATQSFVQLMGLPAEQLSTTYWFPAYNNVTLSEQLRFAAP